MDKFLTVIINFLMKLMSDKQVQQIASQVTLPKIEQLTGLDIPDQIAAAVGDLSLADMVSTPEKLAQEVSKPEAIVSKIAEDLVPDTGEVLDKISPNLAAVTDGLPQLPENLSKVIELGG